MPDGEATGRTAEVEGGDLKPSRGVIDSMKGDPHVGCDVKHLPELTVRALAECRGRRRRTGDDWSLEIRKIKQ